MTPGAWSLALPGQLAPRPLAVDEEGDVWVLSNEWVSSSDARLRRFSAGGQLELEMTIAAEGLEFTGKAVRVDSAGDAIVLGHVHRPPGAAQSVVIGGQAVPLPFASSELIAKLDHDGGLLWCRVVDAGVSSSNVGDALDFMDAGLDAAGNVYLAGVLQGTVDLGGGPITANDVVIHTLSSSGDDIADWVVPTTATPSYPPGFSMAVEPEGRVWLARMDDDAWPYMVRLERYEAPGVASLELAWESCAIGLGVSLDGQGGVFVGGKGDFLDPCATPTRWIDHVSPSGDVKDLVAEYESDEEWSEPVVLAPSAAGSALWAQTSGEDLYGHEDVHLMEIDAGGAFAKEMMYDGSGSFAPREAAVDPFGARVLAGIFSGSIDFGQGIISSDEVPPPGSPDSVSSFVMRALP